MENEIAAIVEDHGAKLYGIETAKEGDHLIYRVLIVKEGGVDVEVCADISAELSPFLDVNSPVSGNYFLEVSSPGIERKLKTLRNFELSIGEKVQLKLGSNEKLKGVLKSASKEGIAVETEFGIEEYALDEIKSARTYFEW
jgi:ribosome maturation factor RimP